MEKRMGSKHTEAAFAQRPRHAYKFSRTLNQACNEHFLVLISWRDKGANVAKSHDEESRCLHKEVYEEVVFPKCNVVAAAEGEVAASSKLQQMDSVWPKIKLLDCC